MDECVLQIQPRIQAAQREGLGLAPDEEVYGLYEGDPLTERSVDDAPALPPRIFLYFEPLLADYPDEADLTHQIQVTVLHEIGHHFGLDEERLAELGFE
ncbi:MAG: metallopeptidase family protein [Planctomycetota bacterium]|nr:metallopeptidase family protein [Planctomycetota bacterium]